jgi:hypothetical protein
MEGGVASQGAEKSKYFNKVGGGSVIGFSKISQVIDLLNANPNAQIEASEPLGHVSNYLLGPARSFSGISQYRRVVYKGIYPGIDLRVSRPAEGKPVEYNFVVHPGGDPSAIQMRYSGADDIRAQRW